MALASGATFAGYIVARMLGSGRTGEVYLVQDPRSSRWMALRVLSLALSIDEEFRRRFERETAIAVNLYHPHILEVHARGEFHGQLWVATDYVDGSNARQLMADRFPAVLPVGEVLAIVAALAGALDYAHERGILHRDVKPANILLTSAGQGEQRVMLADFGLARRQVDAKAAVYAAPEQSTGVDIDGRADQYALAATAFHLLTGGPPGTHADGVPPRLGDQRPELARLDGVFARALAVEPAARFGSCREFADAVYEHAGVSTGDRSPEAVFAVDPINTIEYPAYEWPEIGGIEAAETPWAKFVANAAAPERRSRRPPRRGASAPRPDGYLNAARPPVAQSGATGRKKRAARNSLLAIAAVLLLGGLLAVGIVIGRKTEQASNQATQVTTPTPSPSAAAAPPSASAPSAPPAPLEGTYRIEVQRARQTFDYTPDPQPPNVDTWWAFRSACTPTSCTASAIQLDGNEHTQTNSPDGGRLLVMMFGDGHWQSQPDTVQFPCVGPNGIAQTQTTTQVLSLRPQSEGDLIGEMDVIVQTNECSQRGSTLRIPAVASKSGEVPTAVTVPDPATVTDAPTPPTGGPTTPGS